MNTIDLISPLAIALIGRGESKTAVYRFARDPTEFELRFDVTGYKLR